jgi:NitT/TauT family transport system ATP-binding protein
MKVLEFKEVSKTFGTTPMQVVALQSISFSVSAGEWVSLVGPSGCGKSTLLHIAGGFERSSSGVVKSGGIAVRGPGADRGMIFQQFQLFPWLSVRENIHYCFSLRHHQNWFESADLGMTKIHYADHLLEIMGLEKFQNHRINQLSGGMRQRVAIARTLAARPRIVLMDEPFSALDANTREEMQELLALLRKSEGMTVLMVTHDVEEAIFLSDRIVLLSKRPGSILEDTPIRLENRNHLDIKESDPFLDYRSHFIRQIRSQSETSFDREHLLRILGNPDSRPLQSIPKS